MKERTFYVAYELESACGATIRKLVICKSYEGYLELKKRAEDAGYKLIYFDEIWTQD